MIRSTGSRLPRVLIMVFTAFAVMVSFCLAAVEPLEAAWETGGLAGRAHRFIPSLEGGPALVAKTEDLRLTSSGPGFQRGFIPCGTHGAASVFYRPPAGVKPNAKYKDVKDTILLKLRI
jgi:hypothetical protein